MIRLAPFFAREARAAVAVSVSRAGAGLGVDGQSLAALANGRQAGPAVADDLARAQVRSGPGGFVVRYDNLPLELFNSGTSRQPARRVIGLASSAVAGITRRAAREVARQLQRLVRRG